MQVVHVQHAPDIPGRADARVGGRGRPSAHRPRSTSTVVPAAGRFAVVVVVVHVLGRRRFRADGRRVHAVLRPMLRAVLQQPRVRRTDPGHRPILLRVPQERGQLAPTDAVRVSKDEESVHVHVARGPQRLRAGVPEHPARVHAVLHG